MRYRCKVADCGKTLSSPYNLHRHMTCFHQRIKAYVCVVCSRSFGYSHVLKNHIKCHKRKGHRPRLTITPLTEMIGKLGVEDYHRLMSLS